MKREKVCSFLKFLRIFCSSFVYFSHIIPRFLQTNVKQLPIKSTTSTSFAKFPPPVRAVCFQREHTRSKQVMAVGKEEVASRHQRPPKKRFATQQHDRITCSRATVNDSKQKSPSNPTPQTGPPSNSTSAFWLYSIHRLGVLRQQFPKASPIDLTCILADQWRQEDDRVVQWYRSQKETKRKATVGTSLRQETPKQTGSSDRSQHKRRIRSKVNSPLPAASRRQSPFVHEKYLPPALAPVGGKSPPTDTVVVVKPRTANPRQQSQSRVYLSPPPTIEVEAQRFVPVWVSPVAAAAPPPPSAAFPPFNKARTPISAPNAFSPWNVRPCRGTPFRPQPSPAKATAASWKGPYSDLVSPDKSNQAKTEAAEALAQLVTCTQAKALPVESSASVTSL